MANYCSECGNKLSDGAKFCENCGKAVSAAETVQAPVAAQTNIEQNTTLKTGFSSRVNDPEILAAVKKNRNAGKIFAMIFVPIPIIGLTIYSAVTGKMELIDALKYGGALSFIFFTFVLYGFIRERSVNTYEAVVIDKKHELRMRDKSGDDHTDEYITIVRTTDGKKKKIREYGGSRIWAYNYLEIGDRFRYHPQFAFPYELYDKSKASVIYCVGCQAKNPVEADRCSHCGIPLLK